MKKFLLVLMMISMSSYAESDTRESHGNREDEKKCGTELRLLGCGEATTEEAFEVCMETHMNDLTETCQQFHADERERNHKRR